MSLDEMVVCPKCGGAKTAKIDAPGFRITRCCGKGVVARELAGPVLPEPVREFVDEMRNVNPIMAEIASVAASTDKTQRAIVEPTPAVIERARSVVWNDAMQKQADTALRILNLLNLIVLEIRAANVPEWQVVADACETMGKKIEETTLQGD